MARVAWVFDGYAWPVNPEKDTGWLPPEDILNEANNIAATASTFQFGGIKSARRRISGWIWGPFSADHYNRMYQWKLQRKRSTLKDHEGHQKTCFLISFTTERINDPKSWAEGRPTYRYEAEFASVD